MKEKLKLKSPLYITIAIFVILLIVILILTACAQGENTQYLRLHIRANSNLQTDQDVKYEVRDAVINYLTPLLHDVTNFDYAMSVVEENKGALEELCERVLEENNFDYGATVRLAREQFPARTYGSITLPDGVYDAIIIELGSGSGDNWWCVAFPPLCFVSALGGEFSYKSIIAELWEKYVEKNDF